MGKYHPHGDSSIYDALVVMAQEFKKGMVLVDGHGNFGSIEGDGAAAMRYTEARLAKITQEAYLADLDKDIVDFVPNLTRQRRNRPYFRYVFRTFWSTVRKVLRSVWQPVSRHTIWVRCGWGESLHEK